MPYKNINSSNKRALRTTDADVEDRIRVAITWARLFIRESERQLNGQNNSIIRASAQTVAAIESIYDLTDADLEVRNERRTNG